MHLVRMTAKPAVLFTYLRPHLGNFNKAFVYPTELTFVKKSSLQKLFKLTEAPSNNCPILPFPMAAI